MKKTLLPVVLLFISGSLSAQQMVFVPNNVPTIRNALTGPDSSKFGDLYVKIDYTNADGSAGQETANLKHLKNDTLLLIPSAKPGIKISKITYQLYLSGLRTNADQSKSIVLYNDELRPKYFNFEHVNSQQVSAKNGMAINKATKDVDLIRKQFENKPEQSQLNELHFLEFSDEKSYDCQILTDPEGLAGDVYQVSKWDWEHIYGLPSPPSNNVINTQVLLKLFYKKVGNCKKPITLHGDDELFILVFCYQGKYQVTAVDPFNTNSYTFTVK